MFFDNIWDSNLVQVKPDGTSMSIGIWFLRYPRRRLSGYCG
jgi:hypothetical protein